MNNDIKLSDAFISAHRLRVEKAKDYGGLEDYFPFGAKSYCHEINKKAKRLVVLEKASLVPTHESVIDNLLDLINYASYYYEFLKGVQNK